MRLSTSRQSARRTLRGAGKEEIGEEDACVGLLTKGLPARRRPAWQQVINWAPTSTSKSYKGVFTGFHFATSILLFLAEVDRSMALLWIANSENTSSLWWGGESTVCHILILRENEGNSKIIIGILILRSESSLWLDHGQHTLFL